MALHGPELAAAHHRDRLTAASAMQALACFLVAAIVLFFNTNYFFFWDEWDALRILGESGLQGSLFRPHNEHVFPVFRLYFGIVVSVFRESYAAYILLNCVLHAGVCTLMLAHLLALGVSRLAALVAVTIYLISSSHFDTLPCVFQSQIILSVLFGLVACALWRRAIEHGQTTSHVLLVCIAALLSAWSFTTGVIFTAWLLVCAVWQAWTDQPRAPSRRRWLGAIVLSSLLVGEVIVYSLVMRDYKISHPQLYLKPAVEGLWGWAASLPRLGALCASAAFVGPMHGVWPTMPQIPRLAIAAPVAVLVSGLALLATWRTRFRRPVLGVMLLQLMLFAPVALGRGQTGVEAGTAGRYQVFGMVGWIVMAAMVCQALLTHTRRPLRAIGMALLVLTVPCMVGHVQIGAGKRTNCGERRGSVNADDYSRLKQLMIQTRRPMPNLTLVKSAHPGFRLSNLAQVVALLDPLARPFLPREFRPVYALGQTSNTFTTPHITPASRIQQTWRTRSDSHLESVSLLVGFGSKRDVAGFIVDIMDDHDTVIATSAVPGRRLVNNGWVSANFDGQAIKAGQTYRLVVRCNDPNDSRQFVVWTNKNGDAYADGACTVDGQAYGDLCFEVTLSTPP